MWERTACVVQKNFFVNYELFGIMTDRVLTGGLER